MKSSSKPYSARLFWILVITTALATSAFTIVRNIIRNNQQENDLSIRADNIAYRIGEAISPSIWDICQESENRSFSEEVASALLDSEFRDPHLLGIVVYGNFGHIFLGRFKTNNGLTEFSKELSAKARKEAFVSKIIPINNGPMTIGNIRVYITASPYARMQYQTMIVEIVETLTLSIVFVTALFMILRKALIEPMRSLAIAQHAIESLNEAIVVTNNNGIVVDANTMYCNLFGSRKNNIVGKPIRIEFDNHESVHGLWDVWQGKSKARKWQGEVRVHTNADHATRVNIIASPVQELRDYTVTVLQDIEELKKAEDTLRLYNAEFKQEKERAEKSSNAKDDFLSVMSHELRTPLNPIIGFANILRHKARDTDVRGKLDIIIKSANHLLKVIDSILNYTRIERGDIRLSCEFFDYQEACRNAVDSFRIPANEKGLIISLSQKILIEEFADSKSPVLVFGDPTKISQIILNLISNSVKYTSEGNIAISSLLQKNGDQFALRIQVSDTGIGISKANRELVFQNFTQVEPSLCRTYEGIGLGLAICQKLVNAMGGTIDFNSEPDKGSTFWIELPLQHLKCESTELSERTESAIASQSTGSASVMLVEDEESNLILAQYLLNELGCEITTAHNGEEAISVANSKKFDVILMDLQMPHMNGFEATSKIRASSKLNRETPIIATTAHASNLTRQECLESGMNDFLSKPFEPGGYSQTIKKWLRRAASDHS